MITRRAVRPGKAACAFQNHDEFEPPGVDRDSAFCGTLPAFCRKVAASSEQRSRSPSCGLPEVGDLQRFLDVQFAWFSMRIDASEIVNAIRQVGILLYFADNHVWTDGVRSARGDEKRVASSHRVRFEELFQFV